VEAVRPEARVRWAAKVRREAKARREERAIGRNQATRSRRRDRLGVLRLLHRAGALEIARGDGPLVHGGRRLRRAADLRHVHLHPRPGLEASQPTLIRQPGPGAVLSDAERHVPLEVRDDQTASALDGIAAADPDDRFAARRRIGPLLDPALAP